MAKITNSAFFPAGTISIGTDEYTAAVTGCTLTPTTPTAPINDIGGGTTYAVGTPVWAVLLNFAQDLITASSLSQFLIANVGQIKPISFKPQAGSTSKGFTVQAVILPAPVGGAGAAVAMSSVTLPVNGQPVIA